MNRKAFFAIALVVLCILPVFAQDSQSQQRIDTLRYGIESQVVDLVGLLKVERNKDFLAELLGLLSKAGSAKIREAVLDYCAVLEILDAQEAAAAIIAARDQNPDSTVGAAFSYLIAIKSSAANEQARALIKANEDRYMAAAIKLLGYSGGEQDAAALQALWENNPSPAVRQEILLAFGRMKVLSSYSLLVKVADSDDSGKVERMYACSALGDLGDERAVPILARASQSADPNVRAAALASLAMFNLADARAAVLQGLRDPHALVRTAAVKASAGNLDAFPFLQYQARYDPEKTVREAAIAALGKMNTAESTEFLATFMEDVKNPSQYRVASFSALVRASAAGPRLTAVLVAAQAEKDRAFFLALARALVLLDVENASTLVKVLLSDKDFSIRLGGVAWAERNRSSALLELLSQMAEKDEAETVRKRAASAVEKIRSK